jgi:Glycosyltransferase
MIKASDLTKVVTITTAKALSYRIIAEQICRTNEWYCAVYEIPQFKEAFIGSQYDLAYWAYWVRNLRFAYVTVEGEFMSEYSWAKVRDICNSTRCYVPTKWGKELFESHGVKVQDVIPHALPTPIPDPPRERSISAVYLNAHYRFYCRPFDSYTCDACERKGWRWWRDVRNAFPDALGFVGSCAHVDGAISYGNASIEDVYRLLALGRVYANLSTHEGFGLNPVMAMAVGTPVVAWDIPVFRETMPEAVFVPVEHEQRCYVDQRYLLEPGWFIFRWGNISEFIEAVKKAMGTGVDYASVRQRYDAKKLYTKFL